MTEPMQLEGFILPQVLLSVAVVDETKLVNWIITFCFENSEENWCAVQTGLQGILADAINMVKAPLPLKKPL